MKKRLLIAVSVCILLLVAVLFAFTACGEDAAPIAPPMGDGSGNTNQSPENKDPESSDPCAKGHTEVIDLAVAATCLDKGLTEGKHCSVCNTVLVAQTETALTDHNYVDRICTVCGDLLYSQGLEFYLDRYGVCSVTGIGTCTDSIIVIPPVSPEGDCVTGIDRAAFQNCKNITSIVIPDSVTSIGGSAFFACSALTSITIPSSVTEIGSSAFQACISLKNVTIPKGVTTIYHDTFKHCTSLTSITIPEGVTHIDVGVFDGCINLMSITIPSSITSIYSSFSNCRKLIEVYNFSSLPIKAGSYDHGGIADYALNVFTSGESNSKLWKDENGYFFYEFDDTRYLMTYMGTETNLTLPASCNGKTYEIYDFMFYECTDIVAITIPDSVTGIGVYSFADCTSLASITIPNGVTNIGNGAFDGCTGLTSVTIPNSVTNIGNRAFRDCDSLTSITIPNSLTKINEGTFSYCDNLTSITISNSVTKIAWYAFEESEKLTSITFQGTVAEWNAISKGLSWNFRVPAKEAVCIDGAGEIE